MSQGGDPGALASPLPGAEKVVIKEQLHQSEKLLQEAEKPWETRVKETEMINSKRQETLQSMGISLSSKGIKMSGKSAFLVNLNPDPALSELLVYNLPDEGDAIVGSGESSYIKLLSFGIAEHHATINVAQNGKITIIPELGKGYIIPQPTFSKPCLV